MKPDVRCGEASAGGSLSFCEQRNAALMGTALERGEREEEESCFFMGFGGEGGFSAGASARAVTGVWGIRAFEGISHCS